MGASGGAPWGWEPPRGCSLVLPPRALGCLEGRPACDWECFLEVPVVLPPHDTRFEYAIWLQFRVRSRLGPGVGPWSLWSEPVCSQQVAAAKLAALRRGKGGEGE